MLESKGTEMAADSSRRGSNESSNQLPHCWCRTVDITAFNLSHLRTTHSEQRDSNTAKYTRLQKINLRKADAVAVDRYMVSIPHCVLVIPFWPHIIQGNSLKYVLYVGFDVGGI
jgi:hypothetical protein